MAKSEEKRTNCLACNKSLKRVNRYYRNGGNYCNVSCFKKHLEKQAEKPA